MLAFGLLKTADGASLNILTQAPLGHQRILPYYNPPPHPPVECTLVFENGSKYL